MSAVKGSVCEESEYYYKKGNMRNPCGNGNILCQCQYPGYSNVL